jgi:hypothetical protein
MGGIYVQAKDLAASRGFGRGKFGVGFVGRGGFNVLARASSRLGAEASV